MRAPRLLASFVAVASFLIPAGPALADGPALALIENQPVPANLETAYVGYGYVLAFVPGNLLEEFHGELLMPDLPGDYFIMRVQSSQILKTLSGKIPYVVLGDDAIFKTDATGATELARYGWGLTRLNPMAPATYRVPSAVWPPPTAQVDSNILEMISVITPQSSRQIIADLSAFYSRHSLTEGCRQAEQYVYDYFVGQGYDASFFNFQYNGANLRNVIGEKLGQAYPESIIIVCGHLDCTSGDPYVLAPGAEDNGTGSAVVLNAARAFSELPCAMTIRFMTFSGEEQGLIGSDRYASYVQNQGEAIVAVINVDMVGYSGPYMPDMYIFSDNNSYSLGALGASIIDQYTNLDTITVYSYNPQYGSDHYPFAIRGYPAIFFIDAWLDDYDWYPYYHTTADTLGNLNMAQQASIGQAVTAMAAVIARPDFRPPYISGDANGNGQVNGIDVVYLVAYLKGMGAAPEPYLAGDANGNCVVNGIDVVYLVAYFKGLGEPPFYGDCR